MKKLLKIVYVLGILFWGSFLIYGLTRMIVYNGFGNHYSFVCKNADSLRIEKMPNYLRITYSYNTNNNFYKKTEEVSSEFFHEQIGEVPSELAICYNSTYPSLSYIKDVNLGIVQAKTGITISLFFLAFITVLYLFSKRDYWIQKYKTFFKKLFSTNDPA